MSTIIREMNERDRECVLAMMEVFYHSEAVFTNGSEKIYQNDFDNCVNESPYLEGYIFEEDHTILGYAMLAKSFSTEFGMPCIWIEDLYLKPPYRGKGIAQRFFTYVEKKYPDTVIRLEVEKENEHAVYVYKKGGFGVLPYQEMIKHRE